MAQLLTILSKSKQDGKPLPFVIYKPWSCFKPETWNHKFTSDLRLLVRDDNSV